MAAFLLPALYTAGGFVLSKAWSWIGSGGAERIAETVFPAFEDQVEVTVHGNKDSSRKQLYALALSLAFGKVKPQNLLGSQIPPGMIAMTYDCVEKVVKVIIHYKYSGSSNAFGGLKSSENVIFQGPEDKCVGGPWSYNSFAINSNVDSPILNGGSTEQNLLGGAVTTALDPSTTSIGNINLSTLNGKEILTTNPEVRNPSPKFGMRGTYVERLAYQFLTESCTDPLVGTSAAAITSAKQAKKIKEAVQPATTQSNLTAR